MIVFETAYMREHRLGLTLIALLCIAGCDPAVDRFQENDRHYSIFGYLNASADTQIVRIEPLRDGMLTGAPDAIDAEVALTNLATGQTVPLRDSLFHSPTRHNFYTSALDIEPTTAYRLVVRGAEGEASHVRTAVPDTFSPPTVESIIPSCFPSCPVSGPPDCGGAGEEPEGRFTFLSIEGIDRLVAVKAIYRMVSPPGVWSFGHLADTVHTERGTVRAQINYGEDWCDIPEGRQGQRRQRKIEVVVAAGGADWPDFSEMDLETELLPGVASNVEGGVGFLGGVVTDTVVMHPHQD